MTYSWEGLILANVTDLQNSSEGETYIPTLKISRTLPAIDLNYQEHNESFLEFPGQVLLIE